MKLNKTSLVLLLLGILVIVLANLSAAHSQGVSGQKQLSDELAQAQQRLGKIQLAPLYEEQAELQKRLDQARTRIEVSREQLSRPVTSTDASASLFKMARDYSVRISSIASTGVTTDDLEGISCSRLSMNVRLEGSVTNLMRFITDLNDSLLAGAVQSAEITNSDESEKSSASIQLGIYIYRGE